MATIKHDNRYAYSKNIQFLRTWNPSVLFWKVGFLVVAISHDHNKMHWVVDIRDMHGGEYQLNIMQSNKPTRGVAVYHLTCKFIANQIMGLPLKNGDKFEPIEIPTQTLQ